MAGMVVQWMLRAVYGVLALAALVLAWTSPAGAAEPAPARHVVVARVTGTVDLGVAPFIARALRDAEESGAAAVVLHIDTFGGRLDAAVSIRDAVLSSRVPTVAFVDGRAISAGALIALSAERIVMGPGATIGAATPVELQPGGAGAPVDEKTVSYVRKEFKATAELRGRSPTLAEAMVDADVDVPGIAPKGKLLTLTTDEALAAGIADLRASDLGRALAGLGYGDAEVRTAKASWAEHAVRALTNPIVASLLMSLGMLGLFIELRTPGFGVPGLVGIVCIALFLGGHWIARLAGFEELALVGAGIVLLAVEVFVIPGFGLAGVAGIACLVVGLTLSVLGSGAALPAVLASLARVGVAFAVAIVGMIALLGVLPRTSLGRGVVLDTQLLDAEAASFLGARGVALTPLHPSGTAKIAGGRVDVVSEGDLIPSGTPVEVIAHEGSRVVVRAMAGATS